MNRDFLECNAKAQETLSLDNLPLNQNGRKKAYIQLTKELRENLGHGNFGLTGQNVHHQASRLEKREELLYRRSIAFEKIKGKV